MTIEQAKQKIVNWAIAQIGYVEGENNWNKYATKYDSNVQNAPWCDVFIDVGFIECFGIEAAKKMTFQPRFSALCSASANYYKANNAWFSTPAVGDQIFFNVSGGINHTGIVVGVSGGYVTTVEGNSSDMVRRNNYVVNSSYIAGYGRPDWSVVTEPQTSTNPTTPEPEKKQKTCTVTLTLPVLEFGDKSVYVKDMQNHLIQKGFSCGWMGADGDFGQQTKIALFEFQKKNGLETDTICGQATYKKLMEVV